MFLCSMWLISLLTFSDASYVYLYYCFEIVIFFLLLYFIPCIFVSTSCVCHWCVANKVLSIYLSIFGRFLYVVLTNFPVAYIYVDLMISKWHHMLMYVILKAPWRLVGVGLIGGGNILNLPLCCRNGSEDCGFWSGSFGRQAINHLLIVLGTDVQ